MWEKINKKCDIWCHGNCLHCLHRRIWFPYVQSPHIQMYMHTITLIPTLLNMQFSRINGIVQERFYFGDTVLPLFESGIPLLKQRLKELDTEDITIAYPDEGAWKRFHSQLGEYPEVSLCWLWPFGLTWDLSWLVFIVSWFLAYNDKISCEVQELDHGIYGQKSMPPCMSQDSVVEELFTPEDCNVNFISISAKANFRLNLKRVFYVFYWKENFCFFGHHSLHRKANTNVLQ